MISTVLVEHSALVPWVGALVAACCVLGGLVLLRVAREQPALPWLLSTLAALPVVALTLAPTPRSMASGCALQFSIPTAGSVEPLANVALLFPAIFFATLAGRRPLLAFAAGAWISAAIETVQLLLPALGRSCDTNDWAMNTIGAGLAALLGAITLAVARIERRRGALDPGPVPELRSEVGRA